MLKSVSKNKVVIMNIISIIIGLSGFAYFLELSHNGDLNRFIVILALLSLFDSIIAVTAFKTTFVLNEDKYKREDSTYQMTVVTIMMSVIVIMAAIIVTLIKLI